MTLLGTVFGTSGRSFRSVSTDNEMPSSFCKAAANEPNPPLLTTSTSARLMQSKSRTSLACASDSTLSALPTKRRTEDRLNFLLKILNSGLSGSDSEMTTMFAWSSLAVTPAILPAKIASRILAKTLVGVLMWLSPRRTARTMLLLCARLVRASSQHRGVRRFLSWRRTMWNCDRNHLYARPQDQYSSPTCSTWYTVPEVKFSRFPSLNSLLTAPGTYSVGSTGLICALTHCSRVFALTSSYDAMSPKTWESLWQPKM
mmetsp:Transcript_57822/g.134668  ORF Transcript_57822/g.134668 Transcript_57822/m.134668 type:complete len:258 (-) Transcript_57822:381-1154(-)